MTNTPKLLEAWKELKQTILKKRIKAQEEIKFILHELVLTISSESHPGHYETVFTKYQTEPPEEVKRALELNNTENSGTIKNKHVPFKNYYYQPITLWIKDRAKELGVSWE